MALEAHHNVLIKAKPQLSGFQYLAKNLVTGERAKAATRFEALYKLQGSFDQNGNYDESKYDHQPPDFDGGPEEDGPTEEELQEQREAARAAYFKAYQRLRIEHRGVGPAQRGWIMTRISKALTNDPFMDEDSLFNLVDSLVPAAPSYE